MNVAELPAPVSKFSQCGEEPGLLDSSPGRIDLDLVPRSCHNRKFGCKRIDPQIITPFQLDMFEGERNILDATLCGSAARERHLSVNGHEERRVVFEEFTPGKRAFLCDVMSHRGRERTQPLYDSRGFGRRQQLWSV